jgi:crotonobetainyl-CoA:carnitine CoA-transferase CaiB-like acyl-CoA transferase
MADHGAEILKIEWPGHSDPMRTSLFASDATPILDSGAFFSTLSIGKESLTLNVSSEKGKEAIRRLMAVCDVVVESFSAGMLRRWGFDYDTMSAISPGIIYLSVSGFGHSGPLEQYETWGPTAQAFAGLSATSGNPGMPPAGWGFSYMDICAGYLATVAVFAALHHKGATGVGQYIDLAQTEAGVGLTGAAILDADVNGRTTERPGYPPGNRAQWPGVRNGYGLRGETGAPYGIYPTLGEQLEDYCAITVMDDDQWEALTLVANRSQWRDDSRFADHASRVRNQVDLDRELSEWTRQIPKTDLMHRLQQAGVPAGAVQSAAELMDQDPQLRARGVFPELNHPVLGCHRYEGVPINYDRSPIHFDEKWPILSNGNARILGDIAGYTSAQIDELDALGITWPDGMVRDEVIERALW